MLSCPNDQTELASVEIEGVAIEQCPTCGGQWLHRAELEMLGQHHRTRLEPLNIGEIGVLDSARHCPQDEAVMRQHEFAEHSGVKVDQCPTCFGIWLDQTELSQILNYLEEQNITEPTLSQRVMLFLYQLTARPPLI
jgi:Zn-finger nucleic acid-binding protein